MRRGAAPGMDICPDRMSRGVCEANSQLPDLAPGELSFSFLKAVLLRYNGLRLPPATFLARTLAAGGARNGETVPRTYVALDLETTGLSPSADAIIEIGVVKFRDGNRLTNSAPCSTLAGPSRLKSNSSPASVTRT